MTNCEFQVRNKPIEPPKKPEKAPFFLPSVPLLSGEILFEPGKISVEEKDGIDNEKQMNKTKLDTPSSRFLYLLQSTKESDNCKNPTLHSYLHFVCKLQSINYSICLETICILQDDVRFK